MNYVLLLGLPSGGELIFIVLVIVMLFGSKKIPELARTLGKGMREIKNATSDIQREIKEGEREVNNAKDFANVEQQVKDFIKKETTDKKEESKDEEPKKEGPIIKPVDHPDVVQRTNSPSNNSETPSEES